MDPSLAAGEIEWNAILSDQSDEEIEIPRPSLAAGEIEWNAILSDLSDAEIETPRPPLAAGEIEWNYILSDLSDEEIEIPLPSLAAGEIEPRPSLAAGEIEWNAILSVLGDEETKIPSAAPHLFFCIFSYVLRFNSNFSPRSRLDEILHSTHEPESGVKVSEKLISFVDNLEPLFAVPKPHQLLLPDNEEDNTLNKCELVSGFIDFLLQLLYHKILQLQDHKTDSGIPFVDQIVRLLNELKFLLTVLGDTWLLMLNANDDDDDDDIKLQQVEILLAEFEVVANQAGAFVHYLLRITTDLALDEARQVDEAFGDLFKHIDLVKDNIKEFLKLHSCIITTYNITPKTCAVGSLFIVHSVLRDLEDLISREDDLIVDLKDQINILHDQWLLISQSFLKDINVTPYSQIQELKQHVIRIQDAAYENEYLINSFLAGDAPLWYLNIRLSDVIHKIKDIGDRLEDIKENFDNGASNIAKDFSKHLSLNAKGKFEVDDTIVDLEDKTIELLDQLVGGKERLQIISIFGMPGVGKTTLAKILYNNQLVNYHFHKCTWCTVSSAYKRRNLLVDILVGLRSDLGKEKRLNMEEEELCEHIYKSLKGRRYLIVMDDIWSSRALDDVRRYFPDDRNGSRILITSRNKDVAPTNSTIHKLPTLSDNQCWELLRKKVFHEGLCPPQLIDIGKKIAARCHGLPLSVVVIAGILSTKDKKESVWKNVEGSLASYIFTDENHSVMQILDLSYKHLPDRLRPCFLYFAMFPEDKEIRMRKLVRLWVSEGFIQKEERISLERVAEKYLLELIDKSLVMVAKRRSDGGVKTCIIHDLLRDLCSKIADEESFLKVVGNNHSMYAKHQRLRTELDTTYYDYWRHNLKPFGHHIRSFFGCVAQRNYNSDGEALDAETQNLLSMNLIRILDMSEEDCFNAHIEQLIYLRYLALPYPPLTSIDKFVNLEYLIVTGICDVSISSAILNMGKLRCIQALGVEFDKECGGSTANNLQSLSTVEIYNPQDEEMLKCVPHLRKLKCDYGKFPAEEGEGGGTVPCQYPNLGFLTQLESLHLMSDTIVIGAEVNFPSSIRKLTLVLLRLPWEKLSKIIAGLPHLEVLKLGWDSFMGERWQLSDNDNDDDNDLLFQQLRFLKLDTLTDLVEWGVSSSDHFPKLQRLVLKNCRQLREIPSEMGEIDTLESIEIFECQESVAESARQIQEAQRDFGNEIHLSIGRYFE